MRSPANRTKASERLWLKLNSSISTTTSPISAESSKLPYRFLQDLAPINPNSNTNLKKRSFDSILGNIFEPSVQLKKPLIKRRAKRKESSLKQICTSILQKFICSEKPQIRLNDFARELQVERRRIYDIVNVLEGFDIVKKKGKNVYLWNGLQGFEQALSILQDTDSESIPRLKVFTFEYKDPSVKKKSLTFLSIKLLKLFIIYKDNINFKELIKLFGEKYLELKLNLEDKDLKKSENKNKIRRLYDIVNVFKSLGLIEKITNSSGKSVFRFRGVTGLRSNVKKLKETDSATTQMMRITVLNELQSFDSLQDPRDISPKPYNTLPQSYNKSSFKISLKEDFRLAENNKNMINMINSKKNFNVKKVFNNLKTNNYNRCMQIKPFSHSTQIISEQSMFQSLDSQKSNSEAFQTLSNIHFIKNNQKIRVLDSKVVDFNLKPTYPKYNAFETAPALSSCTPFGFEDLSGSLRKIVKAMPFNNKIAPRVLRFDNDQKSQSQISFQQSRFLENKKNFLNRRSLETKKSLMMIQKSKFPDEKGELFEVMYSLLDKLHLFV